MYSVRTTEANNEPEKAMTTATKLSGNDSFIRGFNYGKANRRELTAREIAVQFPDVDEAAFTQGNIDGMEGDRFRLNLVLKAGRKS